MIGFFEEFLHIEEGAMRASRLMKYAEITGKYIRINLKFCKYIQTMLKTI